MKSKVFSLAALGIAGTLVLSWCCCNDTHKAAKDFCLSNSWTYNLVTSVDEEYGECFFPSGVGCRDDIVLTDECNFIPDTSDIDTEEERLAGCDKSATGWIEDMEDWEDISIDWWDESEAGASFARNWVASYTKESAKWKIDVECVADFVDGSLSTSFGEAVLIEELTGAFEKVDFWKGESETYSQDELQAAVDSIMKTVGNEWTVEVKMQDISYQGDEESASKIDYCKELNEEVDQCVFFKTNFFIPEQDAEMAWAFEPNKTMKDYEWYLGRTGSGEWKVLTSGY